MPEKLFGPKKEDICPNCMTRCYATDVLCPKCGRNLDELYEQLPDDWPKRKPIITLRKEHKLFLGWVCLTTIGMVIGEVFLEPVYLGLIPDNLPPDNYELFELMLGITTGITTGISIGILQWFLLRNYKIKSWQWVTATVLGIVCGSIIGWSFSNLDNPQFTRIIWPIGSWIGYLFSGIVLGVFQWLILRISLRKAWTWIIANAYGWSLAMPLALN